MRVSRPRIDIVDGDLISARPPGVLASGRWLIPVDGYQIAYLVGVRTVGGGCGFGTIFWRVGKLSKKMVKAHRRSRPDSRLYGTSCQRGEHENGCEAYIDV